MTRRLPRPGSRPLQKAECHCRFPMTPDHVTAPGVCCGCDPTDKVTAPPCFIRNDAPTPGNRCVIREPHSANTCTGEATECIPRQRRAVVCAARPGYALLLQHTSLFIHNLEFANGNDSHLQAPRRANHSGLPRRA